MPQFHYLVALPANPRYTQTPGPPDIADVAAVWTVHRPTAGLCVDQADEADTIAMPLSLAIIWTQ